MNREERVLKIIKKKDVDYLPSNLHFAVASTKERLKESLGFDSMEGLDDFLENHIYFTSNLDDVFRYYGDDALLNRAEAMGFVQVDRGNSLIRDRWGVVFDLSTDGLCIRQFPLQGKGEYALKKYRAPDIHKAGNYSVAIEDLRKYSGDYLVINTGYVGIFERAWFLMGFEDLMMNMALNSKLVEIILDKVTEYKIEHAKKTVQLGFKVGPTGDDYGTQNGLCMSVEMWRYFFKPRLAKVWRVYKDAGLPVMHHACGNNIDIIGDMIDIGLDILEPVQPVMNLKYLKEEFGKYITFYGGINTQDILPFGTPLEVKEMATETIRTLGKKGGYIISTSQEIMKDVPIANVSALVETIRSEREKALTL